MDRNTFWSHTAPSYELIESDDSCENVYSLSGDEGEQRLWSSSSTTHYHIEALPSDDQPSITVRVFHTIDVEHEDRREKKFKWFNKR